MFLLVRIASHTCFSSLYHHFWLFYSLHNSSARDFTHILNSWCFRLCACLGNVTNDLDHIVRAVNSFIHPDFENEDEIINDIALLKLRRSLTTLNNSEKFPFKNNNWWLIFNKKKFTNSLWNHSTSIVLWCIYGLRRPERNYCWIWQDGRL